MTNYEYAVKSELMKLGKNQSWLVDELSKHYDGYIDAALISKTIKCKQGGTEKVRRAIDTAIMIEKLKQITGGKNSD